MRCVSPFSLGSRRSSVDIRQYGKRTLQCFFRRPVLSGVVVAGVAQVLMGIRLCCVLYFYFYIFNLDLKDCTDMATSKECQRREYKN
jgi:hypothetical protein